MQEFPFGLGRLPAGVRPLPFDPRVTPGLLGALPGRGAAQAAVLAGRRGRGGRKGCRRGRRREARTAGEALQRGECRRPRAAPGQPALTRGRSRAGRRIRAARSRHRRPGRRSRGHRCSRRRRLARPWAPGSAPAGLPVVFATVLSPVGVHVGTGETFSPPRSYRSRARLRGCLARAVGAAGGGGRTRHRAPGCRVAWRTVITGYPSGSGRCPQCLPSRGGRPRTFLGQHAISRPTAQPGRPGRRRGTARTRPCRPRPPPTSVRTRRSSMSSTSDT